MLDALHHFKKDAAIVIFGTNSDAGSSEITRTLRTGCHQLGGVMIDNMSPELFYGVLSHFDVMVGTAAPA